MIIKKKKTAQKPKKVVKPKPTGIEGLMKAVNDKEFDHNAIWPSWDMTKPK